VLDPRGIGAWQRRWFREICPDHEHRDRWHTTSFFLYNELVGLDAKKRHCSFSRSRLQYQLVVSIKLPSAFALYGSVVGARAESHDRPFGFQLE